MFFPGSKEDARFTEVKTQSKRSENRGRSAAPEPRAKGGRELRAKVLRLRFLLRVFYFCKPCILLLPSKNTVKNHGVFTFFSVLNWVKGKCKVYRSKSPVKKEVKTL